MTIPSLLASLLDGTTPRDAQVMRFSLPPAAIRCSASRFREQNGATRRTKYVVTQSGDGRFVVDYATTHRPFAWLRGDDHVWKCCSRRRSRRCFMTSVAVAEPWRQWTCGHVPLPPPHRPIRPSNERTLERTSVRLPSVRPSVRPSVCLSTALFVRVAGLRLVGRSVAANLGAFGLGRSPFFPQNTLAHPPTTHTRLPPPLRSHNSPQLMRRPPFSHPSSLPPSLSLSHTHTHTPPFVLPPRTTVWAGWLPDWAWAWEWVGAWVGGWWDGMGWVGTEWLLLTD